MVRECLTQVIEFSVNSSGLSVISSGREFPFARGDPAPDLLERVDELVDVGLEDPKQGAIRF